MPGYSLFTEGVSIFSFNTKSKLSEKEKSDFLWTSGVSISINNLRNYISAITSYCPFGKYTLPSVDLTSLLNTKRKELNKKGKSKRDWSFIFFTKICIKSPYFRQKIHRKSRFCLKKCNFSYLSFQLIHNYSYTIPL